VTAGGDGWPPAGTPQDARCTGSGLQASSSARHLVTCANGGRQRGWPAGTLSLSLKVSQYFSTSDGSTTAQDSILHAGIRVHRVGLAPRRGAWGNIPSQLPAELAPGVGGEIDGMPSLGEAITRAIATDRCSERKVVTDPAGGRGFRAPCCWLRCSATSGVGKQVKHLAG
jgi:hypothetical protein